jgi:hypothetical protein
MALQKNIVKPFYNMPILITFSFTSHIFFGNHPFLEETPFF